MSNDIEKKIANKIKKEFNPSYYKVVNESHNHSTSSTESHFNVVIVSEKFSHLSLLKRHRAVNYLLREELKKIHALAIHTYTKKEWHKKSDNAYESPKCAH